jgi:ring-1,2-phenylacetyl-CoA epoxidase subunit PaaC
VSGPNPSSISSSEPDSASRFAALLAHADDNLVLAQRLGAWISAAPELEEDIALGNIALDHLGVARALYTLAGEVEGRGRTEDDLAMSRSEREFMNVLLVEQPNGDFAHTMVRALFFDAYQVELWADLIECDDPTLAGIAARAFKEARYHLRHSSSWVIRLGDGTEESHRRAQQAVDALWRYTAELFEEEAGYRVGWLRQISDVLDDAGLGIPEDPYQRSGGRRGFHSEHLGHLLAEMQWMQRSYPGLEW